MMCANDPWLPEGSVCLCPVVGAYLTVIADGNGESMAIVVPSCERHTGLISTHLEGIAEADGIWVEADGIAEASEVMREALGLDVHAYSLTLS